MRVPTYMAWLWLFSRPKRSPEALALLFKEAGAAPREDLFIANGLWTAIWFIFLWLSIQFDLLMLEQFTRYAGPGAPSFTKLLLFFVVAAFCILAVIGGTCASVIVAVAVTRHLKLISDTALEAIIRRAWFFGDDANAPPSQEKRFK